MKLTMISKIILGILLLAILVGLGVNQYLQLRTMEAQNRFDTSVMNRDMVIGQEIEKTNMDIKHFLITPTPTIFPIKKLTPIK